MTDFDLIYNDGKGHLTVHGENFFPCSQSNLKKLCKIIDTCTDPHGKIMELFELLHVLKCTKEYQVKDIKFTFQSAYQKKCDLEHLLEDGRYPNGLPLKKADRKTTKAELKKQTKYVNDLVSDHKKFTKDAKKIGSNMETLKEIYERWFEE